MVNIYDLSVNIKYYIVKLFADNAKIHFFWVWGNLPDLLNINCDDITQWAYDINRNNAHSVKI